MKLLWFHLMPYTELPEDFRQKHPSVWVDIHSSLFDPKRAHLMYNDFMDEMEYAADCGFDAVCCNEHHSNGYGLMPSPNLIASAISRRTRDTAIRVMGNSLALYNPPTRVAEEFAMIDVISGGRLIAGFPVGTPMDTCFCYGQNPSMLRERYLEAHDLVMKAWQEKDTFAFNGRFNQQRYVNIWPRPIQRPHPPVWIPGGGSVETWQWCAKMDYVYAYLSYFGYKDGQATMTGFWDEMKRLGKDSNPYRAGFLQFVGVAESREQAMELYAEPAEYFYGRCLRVDPDRASRQGQQPVPRRISAVRRRRRIAGTGDGALRRAGRVFLRPLPARRSEMGHAAGLHHRSDATRRHHRPDRPRGQPERTPGGAGDHQHGRHRRSRIRDRRLARRGRRTADDRGDQPQCRPPDDAFAVRQHGQGPGQVQHAAVRREGAAAPQAHSFGVGGPLVAGADGPWRARRTTGLCAHARGRVSGRARVLANAAPSRADQSEKLRNEKHPRRPCDRRHRAGDRDE